MFSASAQRWAVFRQHVHTLSVKTLSETRWECRIQSVKAIRYQSSEIYDALAEIAETATDSMARSEAESLCKEAKNINFLVTVVIWYDLLFQINSQQGVAKWEQGLGKRNW